GAKRPIGRECPDVQLENACLLPRPSAPVARAPGVRRMIDDLARPGDIVGLERRGRVRNVEFAIDAEAIARAGAGACDRERMPAVGLRGHADRPVDDEPHRSGSGSPKSKRRSFGGQSRPEPKAAPAAPANTSAECGGAFASVPDAWSSDSAATAALLSSRVQREYSGSFGSV